ncbi:unnamed protein product [Candida verbasci]|uniref:ERAD-associated E3 ubiquitin-protein ligase component HRD3 n=1 Tax=Candida verbasci TaxID=1227364 RepID=A0A9W4XNR3_9ASCO|nr:unnamed protein product [Candida verbasci]
MLLRILLLTCLSLVLVVNANDDDYAQLINRLYNLSTDNNYLYTIDNIENNLYIPSYDSNLQDYTTIDKLNTPPNELLNDIIPSLEQYANYGYSDAYLKLADLYLFGNFSLPTNYQKAKNYYEKSIEIHPNGHGYFMLGFIHSTGLFGEFPIDLEKGLLYYQFGVENGDKNALLVMAYKLFKGIGIPSNCNLALSYYTRLSNLGYNWLRECPTGRIKETDYNIRISDFNGGLYGPKMSETGSSIEIQSKIFNDIKNEIEEQQLNANDHEYMNYYYKGMEYFKGDYFAKSNYSKAFNEFQKCVDLGEEIYGARNYEKLETIDKIFLSYCQVSLARLYFKGLGVDQDYNKAQKFLNLSTKILPSAEAYVYLGKIEEDGLIKPANYSKAMNYYAEAVKKKSAIANLNIALLLTKLHGDPHKSEHGKNIYSYMKNAVYYGNTEALYHLSDYFQSGLNIQIQQDLDIKCSNIVYYYRTFISRLTDFYAPHLKYAFDQLVQGNFKNSLIGYAIGAEQGFEQAQISTAYLLFQLQPLLPLPFASKPKIEFSTDRIELCMKYLERASKQGNIDATILLGDLYLNFSDYNKAFNYYRIASDKHSSHGSYKLGEMYEYGHGGDLINNSIDYFLAKRHYDNSLQYKERVDLSRNYRHAYSKAHINWALLRLRFKYLFNKKKFKQSNENGWLKAFKKLGKKQHENKKPVEKKLPSRADDHHQGTSYNDNYVEDYDIGDYLVIALTFLFFVVFFIQNVIRQIRRMRGNNRNENNNENEQNNNNNQNFNGQFNFRRGNFEFHFFAI